MRCPFCLSDSKLSREHFLSNPICKVFGIKRPRTQVASVDGRSGAVRYVAYLENLRVRLPCSRCNSGWMSDLENSAAKTFRPWLTGDPLSGDGLAILRRWLIKSGMVLAIAEHEARRFLDNPQEVAVPDISLAKQVASGDAPESIVTGAARTTGQRFIWGVGNPTVEPVGRDRISARAINVAALNLGALQLWVVMPIVRPDRLTLPRGVVRLEPGLVYDNLTVRADGLDPTQVIAEYSDRTTAAFRAAMARLGVACDPPGIET